MNYCVKLNHTLVENIENYDETDILDITLMVRTNEVSGSVCVAGMSAVL